MPSPDKPPLTRAVALRGIGFAVAIASGAVAVWLVVTGNDQQTLRIGMLVGLWGLVLGAYSMFGARRGFGVEPGIDPGREIALREAGELERRVDADERRDWESRLERLINREISTAVGRETAALRNEIAHLRQDLLDKVGGQLRLERIETTRLIGSDLEALQHEVRQLKDANGHQAGPAVRELLAASSDPRLAVRPVVEPARVRPISRSAAEVEADVRPAVDERPAATTAASAAASAAASPAASAAASPAASAAASPAASAPADPAARVHRKPEVPSAAAATPPSGTQPSLKQAPLKQPPLKQPPAGQPVASERTAPPHAATQPAVKEPAARQPAPKQAVSKPPAAPAQPAAAIERDAKGSAETKSVAAQQPASRPQRPVEQSPPPGGDAGDPFAGLPRLSRFTDFVPARTNGHNGNSSDGNGTSGNRTNGNGANGHTANGNGANGHNATGGDTADAGNNGPAPTDPQYTGRRRRPDETAPAAGRHANRGTGPDASGGRRRRNDEETDGSDLLARLLARESHDEG